LLHLNDEKSQNNGKTSIENTWVLFYLHLFIPQEDDVISITALPMKMGINNKESSN